MQIFVYGTLMDDRLRARLVGRRLPATPGRLPGHRRLTLLVGGTASVPAAVPAIGHAIDGRLIRGVDATALAVLDAFEDLDLGVYRRRRVRVATPRGLQPAWTYLAGPAARPHLGAEWDESAFAARHLERYRREVVPAFLAGLASRGG